MDGAFEDWFEATLRSSAREAEDWRSHRRAGIGAYLIKMTRARIAARSAEQIEPTDALLAGKVQRKCAMILLDWPPPDHLGIGGKRGNSCQRKHPAEISWH